MSRRAPLLLLLPALLLAAQAPAQEPNIEAIAADMVTRNNKMIQRLKSQKEEVGEIPSAFALAVIREEMSPAIDYQRVTRRAMARNWKKADAAQQTRIVAAFRALLENTYSNVLSRYQNQKVRLLSAEARPRKAVSTVLEVRGDSNAVSIEYILSEGESGYKVTDIKVEKISLVSNYRRQFSSAIKKHGLDGFVDFLEEQAAAKAQ